jgi:hypothetical protein
MPRQVLSDSDQVTLNVGGSRFTTTVSTLRSTPSLFSAMFSGRHELRRAPDGSIFIDRDGRHFADGEGAAGCAASGPGRGRPPKERGGPARLGCGARAARQAASRFKARGRG